MMKRLVLAWIVAAGMTMSSTPVGAVAPSTVDRLAAEGLGEAPPSGWLGSDAITALSDGIESAAEQIGVSVDELEEMLLSGDHHRVSGTGQLFHADDVGAPGQERVGPQDHAGHSAQVTGGHEDHAAFVAGASSIDAFGLHSRPGAPHVIYIDFDGFSYPGGAWGNGRTLAGFRNRNQQSAFTADDRRIVREVWERVADDYAAFDIDITTEDPNRPSFGMRVVITANRFLGPQVAGAALAIDYFGSNEPAFVFDVYGDDARGVAETVSHESGHTFGLRHDGTSTAEYYLGHGDWAPIMGISDPRPVSHWSKGEYTGAQLNPPGGATFEDDTAVIAAHAEHIADDAGDTIASASALVPDGPVQTGHGLITTPEDVDVFRVSTSVPRVITVAPLAANNPNLDLRARLFDASGAEIASSDPDGVQNVYLPVLPGTWFVEVDGVGYLDPASTGYSDYSSLGHYQITLAASGTPVAGVASAPDPDPNVFDFIGEGSFDPEGHPLAFLWDFGDGTTSAEANPRHVYTSTGFFDVTLTVTDPDGLQDSAGVLVHVFDLENLGVTDTTRGELSDRPVTVELGGFDRRGLPVEVVSADIDRGTLEGCIGPAPRSCTVAPEPGFAGVTRLDYSVSNGGFVATATITITFYPAGEPPLAAGGEITILRNRSINFVPVSFSDPEGLPLDVSALTVRSVTGGAFTGCFDTPRPFCQFRPTNGFVGDATFVYDVTDGANSTEASWLIHVVPGPLAAPQVLTQGPHVIEPGQAADITIDAVDTDTPTSELFVVARVAFGSSGSSVFPGTVTCAPTTLPLSCTFLSNADYVGDVEVRVSITDATNVATGSFNVGVFPPDTGPPTASSGTLEVDMGEPFTIPFDYADPDEILTPQHLVAYQEVGIQLIDCVPGSPTASPYTCRFESIPGFFGEASLSYTVKPSFHEPTATATWNIHVRPPPPPTNVVARFTDGGLEVSWSSSTFAYEEYEVVLNGFRRINVPPTQSRVVFGDIGAGTPYSIDVAGLFFGQRSTAGAITGVYDAFVSVEPTVVVDTRDDRPNPANGVIRIDVGAGGVPVDASSVQLNITVRNATGDGYLSAYPCDVRRPDAASMHYEARSKSTSSILAKPDKHGKVCVYTNRRADVTVHVAGHSPAASLVTAGVPTRLTDSRRTAKSTLQLTVRGRGGVPATATTVLLSLAALNPAGDGSITVFPCGQPRPEHPTLTLENGDQSSTGTLASVAADGTVCIYTSRATTIIADVIAWATPAAALQMLPVAAPLPATKLKANKTVTLRLTGLGGVPAEAGTVAISLVADAKNDSTLRLWTCGTQRPRELALFSERRAQHTSFVIVPVDASGNVCLRSNENISITVAVTAWAHRPASGSLVDRDADGWSPPSDCADDDANVRPQVDEIIGDDIDQNCDGDVGTAPAIAAIDGQISGPSGGSVIITVGVTGVPMDAVEFGIVTMQHVSLSTCSQVDPAEPLACTLDLEVGYVGPALFEYSVTTADGFTDIGSWAVDIT